MIHIVFCLEEGNNQWVEDEFGFDSVTRFVNYQNTVRLLNSFLSNANNGKFREASFRLMLSYKGESHLIDIQHINYIEISKRIVDVHVTEKIDASYKDYAPISVLEKALNHFGFVRVSRFFLVPLERICQINGAQIKMIGGKEIPVGRTYRKELLNILRDNAMIIS